MGGVRGRGELKGERDGRSEEEMRPKRCRVSTLFATKQADAKFVLFIR